MTLDGHNLSSLFEGEDGLISFSDDPRKHIPTKGSIIYTVWDREGEFIYVGISGLQKSIEKRNPQSRMISHASGRRGGDLFCMYIFDYYVIPRLAVAYARNLTGMYLKIKGYRASLSKSPLDTLTKKHIRSKLQYRFIAFESEDSDAIVRSLEKQIRAGAYGIKPLLNSN